MNIYDCVYDVILGDVFLGNKLHSNQSKGIDEYVLEYYGANLGASFLRRLGCAEQRIVTFLKMGIKPLRDEQLSR